MKIIMTFLGGVILLLFEITIFYGKFSGWIVLWSSWGLSLDNFQIFKVVVEFAPWIYQWNIEPNCNFLLKFLWHIRAPNHMKHLFPGWQHEWEIFLKRIQRDEGIFIDFWFFCFYRKITLCSDFRIKNPKQTLIFPWFEYQVLFST